MFRRRSTLPRVLGATLLVGAVIAGGAGVARADGAGQLLVTEADSASSATGGTNSIEFTYTGPSSDVNRIEVTENGVPVALTGTPTKLTRDRGVVFVVDSGPGMDKSNVLTNLREAIMKTARRFPSLEYGLVQAGDTADVRANLTRDLDRLDSALKGLGSTKGSAVWNGVKLAAEMLGERTRLQPNIVLISADDDTVNSGAAPMARAAVIEHSVLTQTLLFAGNGGAVSDAGPYEALAATNGAGVVTASDTAGFVSRVGDAVSTVGERQYSVTWKSSVPVGEPLNVKVAVGDQHDSIDVLAGRGTYTGHRQLHPELGVKEATLPLTDNPLAFALALLLALIGVAGVAYAITTVFVQNDLSNVLKPYADAYGLMEGDTGEESDSVLPKNALVQRAVALTEQVAESRGMLTRAEAALERANLPLRAGEALFGYVVIVVAATVIPLVLTLNVVNGLIFGALGAMIPLTVVSQIAKRRRKTFLGQLPDTLSLLSGTLKAGYSLMQGVEAVSKEVGEPMGLELRRVCTEARLGRPLEESLEASADRMDSPDFAWAVMAIRIQREVGGNLAELLLTVADTMVARERLRRDVAALTAEGRVSAYMLAAMPPLLAMVMYVLNKEYVSLLFTNTFGMVMVGLAAVSMVIGFLWMRKIITIEI